MKKKEKEKTNASTFTSLQIAFVEDIRKRVENVSNIQKQFYENFGIVRVVEKNHSKKSHDVATLSDTTRSEEEMRVTRKEEEEEEEKEVEVFSSRNAALFATIHQARALMEEDRIVDVCEEKVMHDEDRTRPRDDLEGSTKESDAAESREAGEWNLLIDAIFPRGGGINVHEDPLLGSALVYE